MSQQPSVCAHGGGRYVCYRHLGEVRDAAPHPTMQGSTTKLVSGPKCRQAAGEKAWCGERGAQEKTLSHIQCFGQVMTFPVKFSVSRMRMILSNLPGLLQKLGMKVSIPQQSHTSGFTAPTWSCRSCHCQGQRKSNAEPLARAAQVQGERSVPGAGSSHDHDVRRPVTTGHLSSWSWVCSLGGGVMTGPRRG